MNKTSGLRRALSTAAIVLAVGHAARAELVEVVFRQGGTNDYVTDYSGTQDAYLKCERRDTLPAGGTVGQNTGGLPLLHVGARNWSSQYCRSRVVMRWDLSSLRQILQSGGTVRSASLALTLANPNRATAATGWIHLLAFKAGNAAWVEGTATGGGNNGAVQNGSVCWACQRYDASSPTNWVYGVTDPETPVDPWTALGYAVAGYWPTGPILKGYADDPSGAKIYANDSYYNDPIGSFFWYSGTPVAGDRVTIQLAGVDGIGDGSLMALIRQWADDDQAGNAGFILIGQMELNNSTNYSYGPTFHSSEATDLANRPELTLTVDIPRGTVVTIR